MTAPKEDPVIGTHPAYLWSMTSLCVVATFLNLAMIVTTQRFGNHKSSINIFLVNLAVGSIFISAIVEPLHFWSSALHDSFYGDEIMCKVSMFIPLASVCGVIFTMVVMALDRFRSIVLHKALKTGGAVRLVVVIWIAAMTVSAPQIYEYNVYAHYEEESNVTELECGSEGIVENFETVYASVVFVLAFCLPLVILTLCYARIILYVHVVAVNLRRSSQENGDKRTEAGGMNQRIFERKVKVLKVLVSITSTFIALWTPYFILFAIKEISGLDDTKNFVHWPYVFSRIMTVLSTITNPVIYLVTTPRVRGNVDRSATSTYIE